MATRSPPPQEGPKKGLLALVNSSFADTLFDIAGRPKHITPVDRGEEALGVGGQFFAPQDSLTVSNRLQPQNKERVLSHELGHRVWDAFTKRGGRKEPALDTPLSLSAGKELISSFGGRSFRRIDRNPRSGEGEKFAQTFEAAIQALRSVPRSFRDLDPEEALTSAIEKAVKDTQGLVLGEAINDRQDVKRVAEFLLSRPKYKAHPINEARRLKRLRAIADRGASKDMTDI